LSFSTLEYYNVFVTRKTVRQNLFNSFHTIQRSLIFGTPGGENGGKIAGLSQEIPQDGRKNNF